MDNNNTNSTPMVQEENVLAGVVGAFLFALVGGALWFVLYQIGYLAAISGLVGVICAIKGYSFFSKKESTKGVVIATIMAVLVLVIAWYLCIGSRSYNSVRRIGCSRWSCGSRVEDPGCTGRF